MLLEGKTGVVFGVANKRSLAWAIARRAADEGARIADACVEGSQRRRDTGDRDQDRGEGGEPQRGGGRERGPGGRAQDVSVYQGGRGRGPRGGGGGGSPS